MKFSSKEKFLLRNKYKNLNKYKDSKNLSNGTTLVILPDNDIAFDLAQLFSEKAEGEITFLLKDSILSFYPNEITSKCLKYSYNDMNSMGLPREVFIEKIQKYHFENMIDLNITFSRFGAYLSFLSSAKVRMGFNYENSKKYYNVILDSNYQRDLNGTFKMIQQFIKI
jgi:hypothetical protein|tara:strand:- start:53 stop:556 length:504 start_codon:yes stop_codon:yes gene_type:complete